ncbi:hypothetical protein [Bacillus atrophaeus]|uniref:hypothetical protein n=1 Tax=Bacillus atrophaeus TaxID=1452 RepID=UPI002281BB39|nr:hypothetical protein [Bacillus atrophaeus]MCY7865970.1 hypothetical protein [Bacillus spizizenii]MCY8890469.1 hypothetical protein [Bacillus spizizenii]MEC0841924.1 hypothetical protein [Bacillus spizizenii]MED1125186.1 hypothetical protein [Bacillus atrophaeus]
MEEKERQIPVYKYWMPFASTEHYLLLREITELWDLWSTTVVCDHYRPKRHAQLTTMILKKYCEMHEIPSVYYETRHGLKQVYPREVYQAAHQWFLEQTNHATAGKFNIDGKNYSYTIGKQQQK